MSFILSIVRAYSSIIVSYWILQIMCLYYFKTSIQCYGAMMRQSTILAQSGFHIYSYSINTWPYPNSIIIVSNLTTTVYLTVKLSEQFRLARRLLIQLYNLLSLFEMFLYRDVTLIIIKGKSCVFFFYNSLSREFHFSI